MMGVHLINEGKINKSYVNLIQDVFKCINRQFRHFNNDKVFQCLSYGTYFPAIFKDPKKYIMP